MHRSCFIAAFLAAAVLFAPALAVAQGCGATNPNCIVPTAPAGTNNNQAASTAFVGNALTGLTIIPGTTPISPKTNGGILYDNNGILGDSTTLPRGPTIPSGIFTGTSTFGSTSTWPSSLYSIGLDGTINLVAPTFSGSRAGTVSALRTSDDTSGNASDTNITNTCLIVVDNASTGNAGWCQYVQGVKTAGAAAAPMHLREASIENLGTTVGADPYTDNPANVTEVDRLDSGIGSSGPNNASVAIHIVNNGAAFEDGVICSSTGLDTSSGRIAPCMAMAQNESIAWYSGAGNVAWDIYSTATSGNNTFVLGQSIATLTDTSGIAIDSSGSTVTLGSNPSVSSGSVNITGNGTFGALVKADGSTDDYLVQNASGNTVFSVAHGGVAVAFGGAISDSSETIGTQQTTQGALVLANTAGGAYPTTIQSSNSASAAWTLTLPTTAGTNNYVLATNGSGVTSWVAQSGGSGCSVSGSQYQILAVNSAGSGCTADAYASVNAGALSLGASGTAGSVAMGNATSGTVTLQPVTGALGTVTASLPANTGTIGELNLAQTWSAEQTFNANIDVSSNGTLSAPAIALAGCGGTCGIYAPSAAEFGFTNNANLLDYGITTSGIWTLPKTINFTGTVQIGGNTMTFPGSAATLTQTVASGTATMGTSAIASGACASAVTVSASGVASTDSIITSFNANPTSTTGYEAGAMLTIIPYPTSGDVNFIVCNNTGSSITPSAVTLNWRVVR